MLLRTIQIRKVKEVMIAKVKNFFRLRTLFSRLILSFLGVGAVLTVMLLTLVMPAQTTTLKIIFGVLTALVTGGAIGICVWLNCKFTVKPIREINAMTEKIVGGDFSARYDVSGIYDEDVLKVINSFNKMANEFENLEQMRKSFVANASHELRSPLTSMQGFIQGILDGTISQQDSHKYLTVVLSETKRLANMVSSMLDLSRIESGKAPIKKSPFEVNETIRRILIKFEPNITKKDISISVEFAKEKTYVFADKARIQQVLVNLIDNAIKYSPSSTTIHITTHIHGKKLYVSVKDEGIGISKKDQMLIWDRFYMADKARTPGKAKGTGLGLAIVKKIIDEHKEIIWVESDKGEGTTFIFTLELYNSNIHGKPKAAGNGDLILTDNTDL